MLHLLLCQSDLLGAEPVATALRLPIPSTHQGQRLACLAQCGLHAHHSSTQLVVRTLRLRQLCIGGSCVPQRSDGWEAAQPGCKKRRGGGPATGCVLAPELQ